MASLYSMIGRLWWRLPDRVRKSLHRISVTAHAKKGFSRVSAYLDAVAKYGLLRGPRIWWRIQRVAAAESIPVPGSEHTVVVRPGTADADVFRSVFLRDECRVPVAPGFSPRLIVDAGAYAGYSTVYFAQTYPEARVIAIEPQPDNIKQWRVNTEGLDRVSLVEGALWHRHEPLEIDNPDAASYSFRMTARPGGDNAVRSYTIPDLMALAKADTIDILKLDVEGAERDIFRNAGDWIHRVRVICLETHDRYQPGCTEAFLGAVRAASFRLIVEHGEKLVAERDH